MWVKGDLKDQLGISHRKGKRNNVSATALEAAPMFPDAHNRSFSDYEAANGSSPALNLTPRATYLESPPMTETGDLPPIEPTAQYATVLQPVSGNHLSPLPLNNRHQTSVSPQPSYYSASDLPPASPLPSPKYRYPNGEVTSTPPSRRTSYAGSRAASMRTSNAPVPTSPMPTSPLPQPHSPTLHVPHGSPYSGRQPISAAAYEMRVRSPPRPEYESQPSASLAPSAYGHPGHGPRAPSEASHASYATAGEDFWTAEDDRAASSVGHYQTPSNEVYSGPQHGAHHPHHQNPAMLTVDDDDRDTISRDPRRVSDISTWEGARAM